MSTVYFAKWILLPEGDILHNGAVVVSDGTIVSIGPRSRAKRTAADRTVMLGDMLLLPGLVNLHTHLEEGVLRGIGSSAEETFATRFAKKNSRMRLAQESAIRTAVRLAAREALANGITTIVDSSRKGISPEVLADEPIKAWVVHEFHPDDSVGEERVLEVLRERLDHTPQNVPAGIGPYALFSVAPDLHESVIGYARQQSRLWATHIAESAEEIEAFSEQSGDLYFQITHKRPWGFGRASLGPMHYALTHKLVPSRAIFFHCNYVNGHELSLLAAKHVAVAVSMQYTAAQGHKEFPLDVALKRGVTICAVTESIADSGSANLFDELHFIKNRHPHISAHEMLKWVTLNPARALGIDHQVGSLEEGKAADIIGVRFSHEPGEEILEELIAEDPTVGFVMIDGEELIVDG